MSMILRKVNHNYCFCDTFKSHAWYISHTLDKTPFTQKKNLLTCIYFPRWRFSLFNTPNLLGQNGCISFFFCELGQYPAVILTKCFNFCHNYFSCFKHYFNGLPPPSSSIKLAPLNKARILKYPRKCVKSPLFYSLEKKVMGDIRLCLILDGRLYASPECLERKMKKS